jgi:plasmid stabilization system protein ParE
MKLVWTEIAKQELSTIFTYYKNTMGQRTAVKVRQSIVNTAKRLKSQPFMGAVCEMQWSDAIVLRSLVEHKNHRLIYYIEDNTVYIVDIWACRMNHQQVK